MTDKSLNGGQNTVPASSTMTVLSNLGIPSAARFALISIVVIGVYFIEHKFDKWPDYWFRPNLELGWPRLVANAFLYYGIWTVLVPILAAAIIAGPRRCFSALGLDGSVWTAAKLGLIATAILPLGYAFTAPLSTDPIVYEFVRGALLPGIGEEILFRGMLFGLLFRFAGWGFLPAALLGASIFGIGHFYQGSSVMEFLGIFGITGIAGVWWAWMYIEWDNNIWVPVGLHILMNMYFSIFVVSDGTLGSWSFFAIRAAVVLISIGLTVRHAKKRGHFKINRRDLFWRGKPCG